MAPAFNTPSGTVTTTASALNVLVQPDSVEVAVTSVPTRKEIYIHVHVHDSLPSAE